MKIYTNFYTYGLNYEYKTINDYLNNKKYNK